MKAAACDALTLKCDVLWSMLDAIDYAYRDLGPSGSARLAPRRDPDESP
jgi:pyrroloquinoline quinone (PQQ) biosynthesis protein C